jgi:hypothetical protein
LSEEAKLSIGLSALDRTITVKPDLYIYLGKFFGHIWGTETSAIEPKIARADSSGDSGMAIGP